MLVSIENIKHIILRVSGINIGLFRESFLLNAISHRISVLACKDSDTYCRILAESDCECNTLTSILFNNYSEFFRNPITWVILETFVLPLVFSNAIKRKKKEIRIWTAGCSAGQETYSIAILSEECKALFNNEVGYRIFATDQSPQQIRLAEQGSYRVESLHQITLKRLNRWFAKSEDVYTVRSELKNSVDFSVFDLVAQQETSPPSSIYGYFDIIFCSNLLMYYLSDAISAILNKFRNSIAENGVIVTDISEREILLSRGFMELYPQTAIFNNKAIKNAD